MATKYAVRKVKRTADGKNTTEIVDLATGKPIKDTKGYTIISAQDAQEAKKADPKKPYALRRLRRKEDGMNETIFVDAETGEEIKGDLDNYNVLDGHNQNLEELGLLPKEKVEEAKKDKPATKKSGKHDDGGEHYYGIDPNSPEAKVADKLSASNTGYVSESQMLDLAKSIPGAIGLGARGLDIARRVNNARVVNKDRVSLGIEKQDGLGPGQVGDVTIGSNSYPVGYEAFETEKEGLIDRKDVGGFLGSTAGAMLGGPLGGIVGGIAGRKLAEGTKEQEVQNTNLTPDEARKRQSIASAQASPAQQLKANVFKDAQVTTPGVDKGETLARGFSVPEIHLANFKSGVTYDQDLPPREMASVDYHLNPAGRSQKPSSGVEFKVSDVVTDVLGPGYSVDVTSGQEPKGRSPVGTEYRHPLGLAADLKIKDPDGRVLNVNNPQDAQAIKDVAVGMAARYQGNFGMGLGYMGPETMHIDTMDLSKYPGGPQWGGIGRQWANDLDFAREEGVMPSQYYDLDTPPTPQTRPTGFGDMIASTTVDQAVKPTANASVDLTRGISFDTRTRGLMAATLAGELDLSKTNLNTPEGIQEAYGIMSTMENRAPRFGSVEEAIKAPDQYSTWNSPVGANTAINNYKANPDLYDKLVSDYAANPQNNLGFTSYYNPSLASPGWGAKMENTTNIGPHRFGFLGDYQGAFGTNFGATTDTQKQNSQSTQSSAGTGANAFTKVSLNTAAKTSASVGNPTSRGMMSDENADRSSGLSSTASRTNEDRSRSSSTSSSRGSYSSGIGSSSSSEGKGSYGSSGRSGYSSIGSSSGFGSSSSKSSSEGKGSYGSSGRSGYSSIGSSKSSGFGSKSTSSSSTSKNHGYSGSRSDGWS